MAVVDIKKVNLIFARKHRAAILEALQRLGWVQVADAAEQAGSEELSKLEYDRANVTFALGYLAAYDTRKRSLAEKLLPQAIRLSHQEAEVRVEGFDYADVAREAQEVEAAFNQSRASIEAARREIETLQPWAGLPFSPAEASADGGRLGYRLLTLPTAVLDELRSALKGTLSEIASLGAEGKGGKKEANAYVLFDRSVEAEIDALLEARNLKPVDLPALEVTVAERLTALEHQIVAAESQAESATADAARLAESLDDLKVARDWLTWQIEKAAAAARAEQTETADSLLAWTPADHIEPLRQELRKVTPDCDVIEVDLDEDESAPVLLRNRWAQPFESVTGIYGSPLSHEPDPSPFLAPFFLLFFGLALTDAGYGVMLAAFSYAAIKILKLERAKAKLLWVLVYGGIATFIAGVLAGGWFGIVLESIPIAWLRELLLRLQVINPVEEPITMLLFALALGVIQVMVGIAIDGYWKIRHGQKLAALFDSGFWLFFIGAILFFSLAKVGVVPAELTDTAKYLTWAGAAGLIATQGRNAKNIVGKIGGGVMSLYSLVGYFSDVLSYARILALGLATGIIALVINLIASLAGDMIPYIGWAFSIGILIGGHIFNLAINALGAFIHSGRLQFVEFFPKFMEGGGQDFAPLRKESEFVEIKKEA